MTTVFIVLILRIADLVFHFILLRRANYLVLLVVLIVTYVQTMCAFNVWIRSFPLLMRAILAQ